MRNNKGFTLVELLVSIAILGIITGMSIPLIRNIRFYNEQRKFKSYGKTLLTGAKLYRDSYEEDLFGHKKSGCALLSFDQLQDKGLIKDFPDDSISCNSSDTKVRIVKLNHQYGYSYQLYCGTKDSDGAIIDASLRDASDSARVGSMMKDNEFDDSLCNLKSGMQIFVTPESEENKAISHTLTATLRSTTGIHNENLDIQYLWVPVDDQNDYSSINFDELTGWKRLSFRIKQGFQKQQDILMGGNSIVSTKNVTTPTGTAAWYILVLKVNRYLDLTGESWTDEDSIDGKYMVYGIYNVGKEYTLTYQNNGGSGCSNKQVLLEKGESSTWGDLCKPTRDGFTFLGWKKTDNSYLKADTPITENLTVTADWRVSRVNFRIKMYDDEVVTSHTTADNGTNYYWGKNDHSFLTLKVDTGNEAIYNFSINNGIDVPLDLPNYNNSKYLNITKSGMTAVSGKEWICESGCVTPGQTFNHKQFTVANTDTICDSSKGDCTVVLKVNWSLDQDVYSVTLNKKGGSGGTSTIYEKYNTGWYSNASATTSITKVTSPTKTGYVFGGYYTQDNGGGVQIIQANSNIISGKTNTFRANGSLYAKWVSGIYTVTLDRQGGSGGTGTIYEKYNTGWYSNANATNGITSITKPSRKGYVFGGYYTATGGKGTQIIKTDGTIVGNKATTFSSNGTLYAKWNGYQVVTKLSKYVSTDTSYYPKVDRVTSTTKVGGSEVTFTVSTIPGFTYKGSKIKKKSDNTVVYELNDSTKKFTMPNYDVTICPSYKADDKYLIRIGYSTYHGDFYSGDNSHLLSANSRPHFLSSGKNNPYTDEGDYFYAIQAKNPDNAFDSKTIIKKSRGQTRRKNGISNFYHYCKMKIKVSGSVFKTQSGATRTLWFGALVKSSNSTWLHKASSPNYIASNSLGLVSDKKHTFSLKLSPSTSYNNGSPYTYYPAFEYYATKACSTVNVLEFYLDGCTFNS